MLRGLALAIAILCVAGFLTRVLPDVFSVARNFQNDRLSYPLTYWNAMGVIGALGIVLSLHLTSDAREPWPVRVLAAAAFPAIAAALLLSFSRGGIAVAVLGVAVYAVVGRPRALLTALVAVGPATAIALTTTYDADRIAEVDYTSAAAAAQGHHVARVVLACAVGAAALRAVGLLLDSRLMAIELPWRGPRARLVTVGVAFVVCLTVALAAGAPGYRGAAVRPLRPCLGRARERRHPRSPVGHRQQRPARLLGGRARRVAGSSLRGERSRHV